MNKITQAKKPMSVLLDERLNELTHTALEIMPDGIVIADMQELDTPLVWVNANFAAITGYSLAEAFGKNCRYLQGNDHMQPEIEALRDAIRDGKNANVTLRNYRKDGTLFWNELTISPHKGPEGNITHYVGLIRDVTLAKENVNRLMHEANIDRLTGLPSRYSFLEEIESIAIPEDERLLVAKLDLAEMHNLNSTYGYAAGDQILRQIALRLQSLAANALSRVGNNEFAVAFLLGPSVTDETILTKIASVMRPPFTIPDAIISIRYALGYAVGGAHLPAVILTQQAGYALHESKADPSRVSRRFDQAAERNSRMRTRITSELRQAVQDGDFIYHYQPQVDLQTRLIVGAEALIRWNHPVFGLQMPDKFIKVAEETGMIIDIERRGIYEVAAFAAKVNEGRSNPLIFAVNISPLEVTRNDFVSLLSDIIDETGIDPSMLTIELTESLLTEESPHVLEQFRRLKALSVGLSIDDFGTGYSSLQTIDRFPISEIKIDRNFIKDILNNGTKRIVTQTVLSFGRELAIRVVAEGIETEAQLSLIQEMGCQIGQGYLFSRPLAAEQFRALLASEPRLPQPHRPAQGHAKPVRNAIPVG
jgi:PAS domain S-box-containing protein/diguanylate cyclase (GGDEF)-like protein